MLAWIALLAFFCLAFGDKPLIPTFKWGQDNTNIYLTFPFQCAKDKTVEIGIDTFVFGCESKKDSKYYKIDVVLREDIEEGKCAPPNALMGELCILKKKEQNHLWDRLLFSTEQTKLLKHFISADWARYSAPVEEDDEEENSQDSSFEDHLIKNKYVKKFSDETLKKARKENEVVFLYVHFPWCSSCRFTTLYFVNAHATISGEQASASVKYTFGWVDAVENRETRHDFNATCNYECVFYVLKGESVTVVKAGNQEKDAIATLRSYLFGAVSVIKDKNELSSLQKISPLVLGLFENDHTAEALEFLDTATKLHDQRVRFLAYFNDPSDLDLGDLQRPAVVFLNNDDSPRGTLTTSLTTPHITKFVKAHNYPLFAEYSWQQAEKLKGENIPYAIAFLSDDDAQHSPIFREVASDLRGQLVFMYAGAKDQWLKDDFGLRSDVMVDDPNDSTDGWPALAIEGSESDKNGNKFKYGYPGSIFSVPVLKAWCQSFLDQSLSRSFKSEYISEKEWNEWKRGEVKKYNWNKLIEVNDEDRLVVLYTSWHGSWKDKLSASITKIAKAFQSIEGLHVGILEASKNYFDPDIYSGLEDEAAESEIFFVPKGQNDKAIRYNGKRLQKSIFLWLRKQSTALDSAWETLKQSLININAEEEAAKKEEAEKKQKAREELLATGAIDVTGDGGVFKLITKEATSNNLPRDGQKIKANYKGYLLDGTVFDESKDSPFTFGLGEGEVIRCWDKGFATMKIGEEATLTCEPKYAYGAEGSPPTIPPNAVLKFDVVLISATEGHEDL